MRAVYVLVLLGVPAAAQTFAGGVAPRPSAALAPSSLGIGTRAVYLARDNGLKCDGSTDDTGAFNSLLEKASSAGGGNIVLPPATCVVSPPTTNYILSLGRGGIRITGAGIGKSILKIKNAAGDYKTIFGPYQGSFSNVTFDNFTIDENTTNNPVTSSIRTFRRNVFNATEAGSGLTVDHLEVLDFAGVWIINSGMDTTKITDSRFELNTTGTVYYDHSSLYIQAEHSTVSGNLFIGGVNAAGSTTAIETHAGMMTVAGNVIDGYWAGMNITGIAATDSNNVSVTGNTIKNAYFGIELWSSQYRSHTSGYGLRGVTIASNPIRLTQTAWTRNPETGGPNIGNPCGIWVDARANLPLAMITIQGNTIEYDLESSSSSPYDASGVGIGYWDSTHANSITSLKILGNIIKNANVNAIRVFANGSDFEISGNRITNPGSSANNGLNAGYRNGIFIASTVALGNVRVNNNTVIDNQPTSRMARGIYFAAASGSQLSAVENHLGVTGSTIGSLLGFVDSSSDAQLPFVQASVDSPQFAGSLLPVHKVAGGSTIVDATRGHLYHVGQDGRTWTPNPDR